MIGSVAQRKDTASVADLKRLADSDDPQVAMAAIRALGNITDRAARQYLIDRANEAGVPTAQVLAVGLLRCAALRSKYRRDLHDVESAGSVARRYVERPWKVCFG